MSALYVDCLCWAGLPATRAQRAHLDQLIRGNHNMLWSVPMGHPAVAWPIGARAPSRGGNGA
jgi:hypothetical protein